VIIQLNLTVKTVKDVVLYRIKNKVCFVCGAKTHNTNKIKIWTRYLDADTTQWLYRFLMTFDPEDTIYSCQRCHNNITWFKFDPKIIK
jgi:hypothetical protein